MKRRDMLCVIPMVGMLTLAGCSDSANQAAKPALPDKVTLGIMPDVFVAKYNESVPVVLEALLNNDAFSRRSLTRLYVIDDYSLHKGSPSSVFKSVSGPKKTPVFGTADKNGELSAVGVSLGDNGDDARQDFLLIATIIGHALTGESPPKIRKKMLRLMVTLVDNPEEIVAEGIGKILFAASLSKTGIAIQAEHKQ